MSGVARVNEDTRAINFKSISLEDGMEKGAKVRIRTEKKNEQGGINHSSSSSISTKEISDERLKKEAKFSKDEVITIFCTMVQN